MSLDHWHGCEKIEGIHSNCSAWVTTKQTAKKELLKSFKNQGLRVVKMQQTHSNNVVIVDYMLEKWVSTIPDCDALIAKQKHIIFAVKAADCLPILIVHSSGWAAGIHAGRVGTQKKILKETVEKLIKTTNDSCHYSIWFGPCICKECYEIDRHNHIHFDLIDENKKQLQTCLDLEKNCLTISPDCVACNANHKFFSYRKDNGTKKRNFVCFSLS